MPRRLIWFGVLSLLYIAVCFSVHLLLYKSTLELASYRTMIASISGRIHDSIAQDEAQHLSSQISKIEFGGDLRVLGIGFDAKPLVSYLNPATFDLGASLALLREGRWRAAQVKFDSLASKIDAAYSRRTQLLSTFSKLAGIVGLALLLMYAWLWRKSKGHWSHEISVVGHEFDAEDQSFESYLQLVSAEEVKFVGHRAEVSCNGFDVEHIPPDLKNVLELIAEQLVRNSIEHGGLPAEQRLLLGKTDYILIRVTLEEFDDSWLLSVWDNGEGLEGDNILRRALELKLVSQSTVDSLPAEQRIKLIFLQGFTLRRKTVSISDNDKPLSELIILSKRHGGVVSVQNKPGEYCQFSVRFPK